MIGTRRKEFYFINQKCYKKGFFPNFVEMVNFNKVNSMFHLDVFTLMLIKSTKTGKNPKKLDHNSSGKENVKGCKNLFQNEYITCEYRESISILLIEISVI